MSSVTVEEFSGVSAAAPAPSRPRRGLLSYLALVSLAVLGANAILAVAMGGFPAGYAAWAAVVAILFVPAAVWSIDRLQARGLNKYLAALLVSAVAGFLAGMAFGLISPEYTWLFVWFMVPIAVVVGLLGAAIERPLSRMVVLSKVLVVLGAGLAVFSIVQYLMLLNW